MSEKYVHPNGKGSLFVNSYKKEGGNQPDYKGTGTTLDGKEVEISAWKGQTQAGDEKISLTLKEPYVKPTNENPPAPAPAPKVEKADPDLPF